ADGGAGQGARIVAEGEAAGVELLLEGIAVHPGFALTDEVCLVDLEDAVQRRHVESYLAGLRRDRSADAAATSDRRHGDVVGAGPAQDLRHLVAARRTSDEDPRRCLARPLVYDPERPEVLQRALVDRGSADDLLQVG